VTHNDRNLTAFCGIYCGDCIRYKCRASNLVSELLNEIDRLHFAEYAKVKSAYTKEFEDFDSLIATLKAISGIKCEIPCRLGGDGCGGTCEIITCVKTKGFEGCWECDEFEECDKFGFVKHFFGDAPLINLRLIKKLGIDDWSKNREKCYPWL
jgi:hypothetical protein